MFALLSALFASLRRVNEKQLSQTINHFTLGWIIQASSVPLFLIVVLATGSWLNPLDLGYAFWLSLAGIVLGFYPLNTFLYFSALKVGKLSEITPLQSMLGRPLSLTTAFVFLNQRPSWHALVFFVVSLIGVYLLFEKGTLMKSLRHKSAVYTFYGSVLGCTVGILDVIAIKASNPFYFTFISTVAGATVLAVTARQRKAPLIPPGARTQLRQIGLTGIMFGGSYLAYVYALSLGNLAYVSTMRSSTMILGGLLGGKYLGERFSIRKLLGIALILISVCGLALA